MSNAKSLSNLNRGPIGNQHAAKHGARRETFSRHEADEIPARRPRWTSHRDDEAKCDRAHDQPAEGERTR